MTEEQVLTVMYNVAGQVAPLYVFGYNDVTDIIQDGIYECVKVLAEGKFVARSTENLDRQLYAFLRTHLHHRLYNNRRNKSCRYEGPDTAANRAKYNIMHPLKIHSQGLTNSELFSEPSTALEQIDNQEILMKLRRNLPGDMLKLFVKHLEGVILPPDEMDSLAAACQSILLTENEGTA
jgi:hypothetical protein